MSKKRLSPRKSSATNDDEKRFDNPAAVGLPPRTSSAPSTEAYERHQREIAAAPVPKESSPDNSVIPSISKSPLASPKKVLGMNSDY
jgi:hypothetical protein